MTFSIQQSGEMKRSGPRRRLGLEISVADFRDRAAAGWAFWRGIVLGGLAGLALAYAILHGAMPRVF